MNPATLGFVRALGTVALVAVLSYLGDAAHLSGIVSDSLATVIAALALGLEHSIESQTGNGLFGAVKVRK
jgi:hypothetical protein